MSKTFADGLIVKEGKQEFVKMRLSFKVEEFTEFMNKHNDKGWINVDVCKSKAGKLYASLNAWKKDEEQIKKTENTFDNNITDDFETEDIPF